MITRASTRLNVFQSLSSSSFESKNCSNSDTYPHVDINDHDRFTRWKDTEHFAHNFTREICPLDSFQDVNPTCAERMTPEELRQVHLVLSYCANNPISKQDEDVLWEDTRVNIKSSCSKCDPSQWRREVKKLLETSCPVDKVSFEELSSRWSES